MVNNIRKLKVELSLACLLFIEVILMTSLFGFFSPFVSGDVGGNVTVTTTLEVGTVYPELLNVSIDDGATNLVLTANSTKTVSCVGIIRDYNNDSDIRNVTAEFFNDVNSSYGDSDDNNYHYLNNSCVIETSFGSWHEVTDDDYHALANCTFEVEYYSNPGTWNCTMFVEDKANLNETSGDTINLLTLLSLGLPSTINYGTVNSTYVSEEQEVNVTNVGNIAVDLSLSGYAVSEGDGYSMNCSLGNLENISVGFMKFNLTESIAGPLSLTEFDATYTNLTATPSVYSFDLSSRQDDILNEAVNQTYWRVYVPKGVAGTCSGNIVFGAVEA